MADEIPIEVDREAARQQLNLSTKGQDALIALMPGSRHSEVAQLAPTFLDTAKELLKHRPNLHFLLPAAPGMLAKLQELTNQMGLQEQITLIDGQASKVLAAADVALIASGTATLEAALYKCPMVIAYRVGFFSGLLFKRMSYLPWIGLPNILCQETIVPERIQKEMNSKQLAHDVLQWLNSPQKVSSLRERFTELHHTLRRHTAQSATHAIAELLER